MKNSDTALSGGDTMLNPWGFHKDTIGVLEDQSLRIGFLKAPYRIQMYVWNLKNLKLFLKVQFSFILIEYCISQPSI